MPTRREFLQTVAAGSAAASLLEWPSHDWNAVRKEFLIPEGRIYLNVGTLGVQPRSVVDAVIAATRRTAESFPPGVKWDELKAAVAALIDCEPEGLVFPRNTTEAMNFVANGLELGTGDHVITTNHEHIGGLCCWQLIAARRGVTLTQVDIGAAPFDPQLVFTQLTHAVTPRTKVISVSHVNFTTGFVMPVQELSKWCRERGIILVIDGAHPPGLMRMSMRGIDPDFYAGSPHKWLLAPQGTGLLYMRKEWRTRLWPTLASGDWDKLELGAQRFNHLGSFDESRLAGLCAALVFYDKLGAERIFARIEELRQRLIAQLRQNSRVKFVSPLDERGRGLVSFIVNGIDALALQKRLGAHNVRTRVIGEYDYGYMRLSPHVYNSFEELDRAARLIAEA